VGLGKRKVLLLKMTYAPLYGWQRVDREKKEAQPLPIRSGMWAIKKDERGPKESISTYILSLFDAKGGKHTSLCSWLFFSNSQKLAIT